MINYPNHNHIPPGYRSVAPNHHSNVYTKQKSLETWKKLENEKLIISNLFSRCQNTEWKKL